jgi:hypothetical protein
MVVLASLFECMVRFKIVNKSPNHLTNHDLTFAVRCRVTVQNVCTIAPRPSCPLAMVVVVAMAMEEDALSPMPPST